MVRWSRFKRVALILILSCVISYTLYQRLLTYHRLFTNHMNALTQIAAKPLPAPEYRIIPPSPIPEDEAQNIFSQKLAPGHLHYLSADFYPDASSERLAIPSYYFGNSKRPLQQPFDPRFTLGVYASYIRRHSISIGKEHVSVPFHWSDWANLSALDPYIYATGDKRVGCSFLDDTEAMNEILAQILAPKRKMLPPNTGKWLELMINWLAYTHFRLERILLPADEKAEATGSPPLEKRGLITTEPITNQLSLEMSKWLTQAQKAPELERRRVETTTAARGASQFCVDDINLPLEFVNGNMRFPGFNVYWSAPRTSEFHALLSSRSFLYTYASPPHTILFLTENGSYEVDVQSKPSRLLDGALVQDHISSRGGDDVPLDIGAVEEMARLRADVAEMIEARIDNDEIFLEESDFIVDIHQEIASVQAKADSNNGKLSTRERTYLESMNSQIPPGQQNKYFKEANLLTGSEGAHYDWRFFNGLVLDQYERELVFHRLARAWFSFTRRSGLRSWLAHGALLSWYWNAMAFPWDIDLDVQMPIRDLHKLARNFNETLVVENIDEGTGRYLIDCSKLIGTRVKGSGKNTIDARFIDVDTGLYIDITGLSLSDTPSPEQYAQHLPAEVRQIANNTAKNRRLKVYNCRNNHFLSLDEISPLKKTLNEGRVSYVPNKSTRALTKEYSKGVSSIFHKSHMFLDGLRIWVAENELYYFLLTRDKWASFQEAKSEFFDSHADMSPAEAQAKFEAFAQTRSLEYKPLPDERLALKNNAVTQYIDGALIKDLDYVLIQSMEPNVANLMPQALKIILSDLTMLLESDSIFRAYWHARSATESRVHFAANDGINATLLPEAGVQENPPFKCDPFFYRMYNSGRSWNGELERYASLNVPAL